MAHLASREEQKVPVYVCAHIRTHHPTNLGSACGYGFMQSVRHNDGEHNFHRRLITVMGETMRKAVEKKRKKNAKRQTEKKHGDFAKREESELKPCNNTR